ncbi:hypothetical protein I7I53_00333 [Histoplasma capsulatum var. duboisii H88]|uniref:Uncharacterized protein n=1 Tax=Ajellomyces capsulatus (strain H88) TaxID=544711 RepID=A0A8A1LGI0_AJEC8|nr:hypothetical protein I7I53_00333 [Histoplasma capsulatum var. duboisii H88]
MWKGFIQGSSEVRLNGFYVFLAGSRNAVEKVTQQGATMPLGKDNGNGNGNAFRLSSWKISPGKVYCVWRQRLEGIGPPKKKLPWNYQSSTRNSAFMLASIEH